MKRNARYNLVLTEQEMEELIYVCDRERECKAVVLRRLIRERYRYLRQDMNKEAE